MAEIRHITLRSEEDTAAFAAKMAAILRPSDTLLLAGEIGAGKSAFSRALIRVKAGAEIDVPSPTFTLVQTYDFGDHEVWHCDLYRLTSPDEALELGLDEAFETAICLIEWPDRLGEFAPDAALTLTFSAETHDHSVRFAPTGQWIDRLALLDD